MPDFINTKLKEACRNLGWENYITAHVLRHSFASNLIRSGSSVVAVQKLLGHSDLKITSQYLHQDLSELDDAVNRL